MNDIELTRVAVGLVRAMKRGDEPGWDVLVADAAKPEDGANVVFALAQIGASLNIMYAEATGIDALDVAVARLAARDRFDV